MMEFIIGAISLSSLVLNYLIFRKVAGTYLPASLETQDLTTHDCCKEVIDHLEASQVKKEEAPPKAKPQDSGPWRNQRNIPWEFPNKTPEPAIIRHQRGPLERPDGFV